jgi:hypothetical protein
MKSNNGLRSAELWYLRRLGNKSAQDKEKLTEKNIMIEQKCRQLLFTPILMASPTANYSGALCIGQFGASIHDFRQLKTR